MYPVFLNITGKLCVVVGGGSVAERKVKTLVSEGAFVRVISPDLTVELTALAAAGKIDWQKKSYNFRDLDKAFLVFAATDNPGIQHLIAVQAKENKQLVNVADDPESCSFHVPATIRRGDLAVAISTGGKSPAVAARIKNDLADDLGTEYNILLDIMAMARAMTGRNTEAVSQEERKNIYKKILHDDIIEWIKTGQVDTLQSHLLDIFGPEAESEIKKLKLGL